MKKSVLSLAVALALCTFFTACSDDDDYDFDVDSPIAYANALASLYPQATHIDWDYEHPYYVAECKIEGWDAEVWFGPSSAVWAMTEYELGSDTNALPDAVYYAFCDTRYAGGGWMIDEIEEYQRPDGTFYVIDCESDIADDVEVFISSTGEILQIVPDDDMPIRPHTIVGL